MLSFSYSKASDLRQGDLSVAGPSVQQMCHEQRTVLESRPMFQSCSSSKNGVAAETKKTIDRDTTEDSGRQSSR